MRCVITVSTALLATLSWASEGHFLHRIESLSFASLPARISAQNKFVASARALVEVARAKKAGIRLSNPEISIGLTSYQSGGRLYDVALSQSFPLARRLARERDVAYVDIAQAALEVERRIQELTGEVALSYASLLANDTEAELFEDLLAHMKLLEADLETRVAQGLASADELDAFRLELYAFESEGLALAESEDRLRLELNDRLFAEPNTRYVPVNTLKQVLSSLHRALEQATADGYESGRADLRSASLDIDRAGKERALARAARWGDASVDLFGGTQETDGEQDDFVGFRFTIPLPLWNTGRDAIREAEARSAAALETFEGLKLRARNEIAMTARLSQRADQKCGLIEERVLPTAERLYRSALAKYESGQIEASALFASTQSWRKKQGELARCEADLVSALLARKRALGLN
jgi:cobalt-zinc-cadmium efflux system outer membrane protein